MGPPPNVPGTGITSVPGGAVSGNAGGMNMTLGPDNSGALNPGQDDIFGPGQGTNVGTGKEVGPWTNPSTTASQPTSASDWLSRLRGLAGIIPGLGPATIPAIAAGTAAAGWKWGEPGRAKLSIDPQIDAASSGGFDVGQPLGSPSNGPTGAPAGPATGGGYNPLAGKPTGIPFYDPLAGKPTGVPFYDPLTGKPPYSPAASPAASGAASPTVQPAPSSGPVATRAPAVPASAVNLGYYTGGNTPNSMGGARNPQWQQYQNPNDPRIFKGPLAQPAPSAPVSPAGATAPTGFQLPNNLDWASILKGMNYSGQQVT